MSAAAQTDLPPLPDFAPVFKHIMTVDGTARVAVYNAMHDMLHAYARAAIANAAEEMECVRQALPEEWRDSVPSVAVATLVAELELRRSKLS